MRVEACRLDRYLLDVFHLREGWASGQIMFEGFDAVERAFSHSLHAPVRQITHVARDLMAGRRALRKVTVAHLLHFPADQKLSRSLHPLQPLALENTGPLNLH